MLDKIKDLYSKLDNSFIETIRVLSNLVRLKKKEIALHQKETTKLSKQIAEKMHPGESMIKEIEIASFLHDIGKIGIKDSLLNKTYYEMPHFEQIIYMKPPILGQASIQSIGNLQNVGVIIKHHHERWDDEGYPDCLSKEQIPLSSRIITIASDYDDLLKGFLVSSRTRGIDDRQFILENSGKRYDPEIVKLAFPIFSRYENDVNKNPGIMILSSVLH